MAKTNNTVVKMPRPGALDAVDLVAQVLRELQPDVLAKTSEDAPGEYQPYWGNEDYTVEMLVWRSMVEGFAAAFAKRYANFDLDAWLRAANYQVREQS